MSNYYDAGRLSRAHRLVIDRVPSGSRVLELGANTGYVSTELRARGCHVTATDIDRDALALLRERADDVHWCDLNDHDTLRFLDDRPAYDVIVLADVLEHLRDPAAALAQLGRWLTPGGRIVVSMPNIAYWSVRVDLLRGRFERTPTGILDRTHLHFFTLDSAEAMFREGGTRVLARDIAEDVPLDTKLRQLTRGSAWGLRAKARLNAAVSARWPALFAYQAVWQLEIPSGRQL